MVSFCAKVLIFVFPNFQSQLLNVKKGRPPTFPFSWSSWRTPSWSRIPRLPWWSMSRVIPILMWNSWKMAPNWKRMDVLLLIATVVPMEVMKSSSKRSQLVMLAPTVSLLRIGKVHIFWEGHKILRNLPLLTVWLSWVINLLATVHTVKSKGKISQYFVAFSKYIWTLKKTITFRYFLKLYSKLISVIAVTYNLQCVVTREYKKILCQKTVAKHILWFLKRNASNFLNDEINIFLFKSHGVILDSNLFHQSYFSWF